MNKRKYDAYLDDKATQCHKKPKDVLNIKIRRYGMMENKTTIYPAEFK